VFKYIAVAVLLVVVAFVVLNSGPTLVDTPPGALPPPGDVVVGSHEGVTLQPQLVVAGLDRPVDVVADPLSDRLFVVEKPGTVRIVDDGRVLEEPFLDIVDEVLSEGNEQGLLSLRFHPDFESNGRVLIFFTDLDGTSQLMEASVSSEDPDRLDRESLKTIMTIPQRGQYHQSGSMFFGPDGFLWLSLGDGGGIGDPDKQGQNTDSLLATIVRIDVDHGRPYAIPSNNPFVSGGGRPEVWAYGVRNPWRISYDETTGFLYIPDVGQEGSEELNVIPMREGGHNFGWSVSEGTGCYDAETCDMRGHTLPVYEYLHNGNGCAMVGGQVYRGELMKPLQGHFFFADYCLGWIRSVVLDDEEVFEVVDWTTSREDRLGNVTTIGADSNGELYVANLDGEVWRLEIVPESTQ
jgi:glucose/arabinose dehydrogenase